MMDNAILSTLMWVLFFAVVAVAVVWVVASRVRSRSWGHPTEFASTMPEAPPHEREILEQQYARGEISLEEYERRLNAMTREP